jgi:hypothetical protein
MIAADGNAGRMNLRVARVREQRAALVRAPAAVTFEFTALVER